MNYNMKLDKYNFHLNGCFHLNTISVLITVLKLKPKGIQIAVVLEFITYPCCNY